MIRAAAAVGLLSFAALLQGCALFEHKVVNTDPSFIYRSITVDGVEYKYSVYTRAQYSPVKPERALLFLHGRGECGTDGFKQNSVGLPTQLFIHPDRWPFMVVMPQKHDPNREWEDYADVVMQMLDRELKEHTIDKDRAAITGLSQGGHGTIQLAAMFPDRFRAAVPVCGYVAPAYRGSDRSLQPVPTGDEAKRLIESFRTTPIRLFHGGQDSVIPASQSADFHTLLVTNGIDSDVTIYPDLDHNSWDATYNDSGIWEWLVEMTD